MAAGRPHSRAAEECLRSFIRFQNYGDRVPLDRENVAFRVLSFMQRKAEAGRPVPRAAGAGGIASGAI